MCEYIDKQSVTSITTGISLFAVCQFFAVCWLTAKKVFVVRLRKTDGKELADGKEGLCHPLADGKESLPSASRRQR